MSDLLFIEPERPQVSQLATWSFVLSISGVVVLVSGYYQGDPGLTMVGLGSIVASIILGMIAMHRRDTGDGRICGMVLAGSGLAVSWLALAVAFLHPGAHWNTRSSSGRSWSLSNLEQIGMAFRSYVTSEGRLPPAVVTSPDGRPLYSWRVLILPYVGERDLYRSFNLAEAWDGPTNRNLLGRRPWVYNAHDFEIDGSLTYAQVFHGPGAAFDDRRGEPLRGFIDSQAETILVVEGSAPVAWSRPIDLPFSEVWQIPPLGRVFKDGTLYTDRRPPDRFNALFADGTARSLPRSMPETVLRALITRDGGEPIDLNALR